MPVVTALRATRRGGVALHVDDTFVCTVSEAMVARWRLFKGRELDDDALAELRLAAASERVRADAYRLLGHRARSKAELTRRLIDKDHDEAAIAGIVAALEADGLLDDAEFARRYVADKRTLGGWGSGRIRRGLLQLGVAPEVIDAQLGVTAGDDADELERALAALRRRGAPSPPLDAARRKAYQALLRRGFSGSVAYAAVRRWSGAPPGGGELTP